MFCPLPSHKTKTIIEFIAIIKAVSKEKQEAKSLKKKTERHAVGTQEVCCVPREYFALDRAKEKEQQNVKEVRNFAIVAHPDAGKTTLSDALLHKAGLLHKDRVGTGRSLDTLKDEKERGITIKSAAVTLELRVKEDVLGRQKDNELVRNACDIYVGNLPFEASLEEVMRKLKDENVLVAPKGLSLHAKRGYAVVHLNDPVSIRRALGMDGKVELQGRTLVVQMAGDGSMNLLKSACQEYSVAMPSLDVSENDGKFVGVASWPALGGVLIQAPTSHSTKREAREAIADECRRFLVSQQHGHTSSGDDEESRDEAPEDEHTVSDGFVPLMVNLIDSPGHIEFSAEVTAALRVSDGALVVVDALEGIEVQTEEVLKQALREGVRPVLMINKVDRLILDQRLKPEEIYHRMQRVVDDINKFIATHQRDDFPDQQMSFADGSVCFGSGYFGWSCSVESFGPVYQSGDTTPESVRKSLAKPENFIKQIIRPIVRMHRASGVLPSLKGGTSSPKDHIQNVTELLSMIGGKCSRARLLGDGEDASTLAPRKLLKKAMFAWLPAADAIINMVAAHIPSPTEAQRRRAPILYTGGLLNDPSGLGISRCDPGAPAVVYISKMTPDPKSKNLLSFGRVFSGTIRAGDTLRALRTDGTETKANIKRIMTCGIGGRMFSLPAAEAGQIVALVGVDHALNKAGTLASAADAKPIRHMTTAVSPILRHAVRPKNSSDLAKMVTALNRVADADTTAIFFKDPDTDQYILAGSGSLHIEVLVSTLSNMFNIEVELSKPMIAYQETVEEESKVALAKSENRHNRIFIKASPLTNDVVEAMMKGDLVGIDPKRLGNELVHGFGWAGHEASRIWAVGPEPLYQAGDADIPTCLLVDSTYGIQILQDARENIVAAFHQVVRGGVLVGSPMRGVRFDLVDAKFHPDAAHRRPASVGNAAARAMKGAFLMAQPRLVEPMYRADIAGATGSLHAAYSVLGKRSATIVNSSSALTTDSIEALLPVRNSFGLAGSLRGATKGHAHCFCSYRGVRMVPEKEEAEIVVETRKRKGLAETIPRASDILDKM